MRLVPYLFTLALTASLGMLLQPLAGKLLLPAAGGTPAVWSACLVFFQAALLLGYFLADRFAHRRLLYLLLWVIALVATASLGNYARLEWVSATNENLAFAILAYLAVAFGPGYTILTTSAPTLQRWFTWNREVNPYPLYAVGNVGSLAGLLAYPFFVEPYLKLEDQLRLVHVGIVVAFLGVLICLVTTVGAARSVAMARPVTRQPMNARRRVIIIVLAATVSCWLAASTTHITTDLAPIPLLWVLPLALYLLSFIVVFSGWPERARRIFSRVVPIALVILTLTLAVQATEPMELVLPLHLAVFFLVALFCHGEIVARKPEPERLTDFYLCLSLGGVLGGFFVAIVAPWLFQQLGFLEYPLAILAVALVRYPHVEYGFTRRDSFLLVGLFALGLALRLLCDEAAEATIAALDPFVQRIVRSALLLGLPAVLVFTLVRQPVRFAVGLGLLWLAGTTDPALHGTTLEQTRNFFGQLRVTRSADGKQIRLVHGTTQHGSQWVSERDRPRPLMYYHERGPVGRFFRELPQSKQGRVGVVGLGVGAMAAYARPESRWTFFEIDPAVIRIAESSGYFQFLAKCPGEYEVLLGDARTKLATLPNGTFDVLVLDAFSSDAVPVHLLTLEAFQLYASKLKPDGVLLLHLSNRYLDLLPLAANAAGSLPEPFRMRVCDDFASDQEAADGKFPSTWATLARRLDDWGPTLAKSIQFQAYRPERTVLWTDNFTPLRGVWKQP